MLTTAPNGIDPSIPTVRFGFADAVARDPLFQRADLIVALERWADLRRMEPGQPNAISAQTERFRLVGSVDRETGMRLRATLDLDPTGTLAGLRGRQRTDDRVLAYLPPEPFAIAGWVDLGVFADLANQGGSSARWPRASRASRPARARR